MKKINRSKAKGYSTKKDQECLDQYETSYAEGILALYSITSRGQMRRKEEVKLNMSRRFIASSKGNMTITRSTDKNLVSIVNFDKYDVDEKYFHI
jgi:hypothetical protein